MTFPVYELFAHCYGLNDAKSEGQVESRPFGNLSHVRKQKENSCL